VGFIEEEGEAYVAVGPLWSTHPQRIRTPSGGRNYGKQIVSRLCYPGCPAPLFTRLYLLHCIKSY
jgi:hypothetical protein